MIDKVDLELLERYAFCFRHLHEYPHQLKHHDHAEKGKNWPGIFFEYAVLAVEEVGREQGNDRCEDPVNTGSERLARGPEPVGKDL